MISGDAREHVMHPPTSIPNVDGSSTRFHFSLTPIAMQPGSGGRCRSRTPEAWRRLHPPSSDEESPYRRREFQADALLEPEEFVFPSQFGSSIRAQKHVEYPVEPSSTPTVPPPVIAADVADPGQIRETWKKHWTRSVTANATGPDRTLSSGYDNNGDGAAWRELAVAENAWRPWTEWDRGICDVRPYKPMVVGRLIRHAFERCKKILRSAPCEHKIGMCRCPKTRFMFYQESETWVPEMMFLIGSTSTREGAFFMEAAMIWKMEDEELNIDHNINYHVSLDKGGEGPRLEAEMHNEHFVYIAVKPLRQDLLPS